VARAVAAYFDFSLFKMVRSTIMPVAQFFQ